LAASVINAAMPPSNNEDWAKFTEICPVDFRANFCANLLRQFQVETVYGELMI